MRAEGFVVRLNHSALREIIAEAKRWRVRETGGILVGYWVDEESAIITNVSGPGPKAHHGLYTFEPDSTFSQQQLNKIYYESDGQKTYIGDWHTHPLGSLEPSASDSETTFNVASDPDFRTSKPILLLFRLKLFSDRFQVRPLLYIKGDINYHEADLILSREDEVDM